MRGKTVVEAGLWAAALAAAAVSGVVAVQVVGDNMGAPAARARQPREIAEALSRTSPPPPAVPDGEPTSRPGEPTSRPGEDTSRPGEPTSRPGENTSRPGENTDDGRRGAAQTVVLSGGSVLLRCVDGRVTILSWTPDPDFVAAGPDHGLHPRATVEFRSRDRAYRHTLYCTGDDPTADTEHLYP